MPKKKAPEKKKEVLPDNVEAIEWKEITYTCPTRGKVTEKVKVTKYKPKEADVIDIVKTSDPLVNEFDLNEINSLDDDDMPLGGNDD